MTTGVLDRTGTEAQVLEVVQPPVAGDLHRPPTLLGRRSSPQTVRAGRDLARRAIVLASEDVPQEQAVQQLRSAGRGRVLEIAHDYLGYTRFDVPLDTQVRALFLIDHVRTELVSGHPDQRPRSGRFGRGVSWMGRGLLGRVRTVGPHRG